MLVFERGHALLEMLKSLWSPYDVVAGPSWHRLSSCEIEKVLETDLSPKIVLTFINMYMKRLHQLISDVHVQSVMWACTSQFFLSSATY